MSKVSDLEQEIRRIVNEPRKRSCVLNEIDKWYKLCSSMDVIGDTEMAFTQYLNDIEKPAEDGELYYLIYGILQALFIQQDAVKHLKESLGLSIKNNTVLQKIRYLRNNSIGHPTERSSGTEDTSYNSISRISMTRSGFTLLKSYRTGENSFVEVDIPELIHEQREALEEALIEVLEEMKMEELNHRKQHRDNRLSDLFPQGLSYLISKVGEGILGDQQNREFGFGVFEIIDKVPKEYKRGLQKRDIFEAYELKDDIDITNHALNKIRNYYEQEEEVMAFTRDDAWIYLSFVKKQLNNLYNIALEIDKEYDSDEI